MKRNLTSAFTLIEMLTVMAIIAVIASLVMGVSGLVQSKAARARAEGEIAAMSTAIAAYAADNGTVPRNDDTDELDPRTDGNPTGKKYEKASLHLYEELSGDNGVGPDGSPTGTRADGKIDGKFYYEFKPDVLNTKKNAGKVVNVENIQDPFGNCYGYSTAGIAAEQEFLKKVRKSGTSATREASKGYNTSTFDLWSTAGARATADPIEASKKWVKNW